MWMISCQIVLYTMDIDVLTPGDQLEYYSLLSDFSIRQSLTDQVDKLVPIYTNSSAVGLKFQTDDSGERRGFWLQFVGIVYFLHCSSVFAHPSADDVVILS